MVLASWVVNWTVGPFLMRFPGGASFGARGRLAFRHRGAHRHRAARARHGEFGDFADPQQRQPELHHADAHTHEEYGPVQTVPTPWRASEAIARGRNPPV